MILVCWRVVDAMLLRLLTLHGGAVFVGSA